MTTKLRFGQLLLFFALSLGIFLNSCTKDESLNTPLASSSEKLQLKSGLIDYAHTEDVFCDLIAGQTIPAGQVIVSHDGDNIYVEYLTTGGWGLSEVHLYIGTADGVPKNKTAIQIGLFPHSYTNLNGLTSYKIPVSISSLPDEPNEGYAIFAHAVVVNGDQQETAWSNGCAYKPLITVKSSFKDRRWACSTGLAFGNNDWCAYLGTNIYSGTDTYLFQSYYPSMANAGHINVSDNGSQLLVDVYANTADGFHLASTYVYVGNMSGLQGYVSGYCPVYENFPDYNLNVGDVHSFSFPLSLVPSLSFKEEFGSNRWGWFFNYPLN